MLKYGFPSLAEVLIHPAGHMDAGQRTCRQWTQRLTQHFFYARTFPYRALTFRTQHLFLLFLKAESGTLVSGSPLNSLLIGCVKLGSSLARAFCSFSSVWAQRAGAHPGSRWLSIGVGAKCAPGGRAAAPRTLGNHLTALPSTPVGSHSPRPTTRFWMTTHMRWSESDALCVCYSSKEPPVNK